MDNTPHTTTPPGGPADEARVMELLPWFARGSLGADDQAFVQGWLQAQPALPAGIAAELAWLRSTQKLAREAAQARASDAAETRLVDEGLARLMARVRAEPEAAPARLAAPASATAPATLGQRLQAWLAAAVAPRGPAWAYGVAALVTVQAAVITTLLIKAPAEQEPLSGAAGATVTASTDVLFTVAFKPQANEQAIRQLLARAQGQLVGGPSALGLYRVAVPRGQADAALVVLTEATAVIESVQRDRP